MAGIALKGRSSRSRPTAWFLATEFDNAARLGGLNIPAQWRVSNDVSFAVPTKFYGEKLITLLWGREWPGQQRHAAE